MKILSAFLAWAFLALAAGAQVVPILDLKAGGLLGGVKNGKFVDAKTAFGALKKGQEYRIYDFSSGMSQDALLINLLEPEEPCPEFYSIDGDLAAESGVAIGANASWNVIPRAVKQLSLTDKTYLNLVGGILKSKGLAKAKPRIEQAARVDLDGDGTEEVLISATSYAGNPQPRAKAGDYSFVLLRKVVGKTARNIMLVEEYIKKNIEFGAPSKFEISAVGDLNGDGKMEIVVYGAYYEGAGATVYEMKGNKPTQVLDQGCGV